MVNYVWHYKREEAKDPGRWSGPGLTFTKRTTPTEAEVVMWTLAGIEPDETRCTCWTFDKFGRWKKKADSKSCRVCRGIGFFKVWRMVDNEITIWSDYGTNYSV